MKSLIHLNPLNVKNKLNDPWIGSTGQDNAGHAIFSNIVCGIRAGIFLLARYQITHNRCSPLAVCERWAGDDDTLGSIEGGEPNNPVEYATYIADHVQACGGNIDHEVAMFWPSWKIKDHVVLLQWFRAMNEFESYPGCKISLSDMESGMAFHDYRVLKYPPN